MSTARVESPPRPPLTRRDVLVVLAYAALVVLLGSTGMQNSGFLGEELRWPTGVSVALMLLACVSVLWRRRNPAITLAVAGPLALAEIIVSGQVSAYVLLFEALFEPIMHGSRRLARLTTALGIGVGALAFLVPLALGVPGPILMVVLLVGTLVLTTPLLWGWEVRHHRVARLAAETLADVEHELAATRAAHAVETERRQIAHDLHDVIAGHLSAVSLHTNLAASLEDREARERSLTTARESSHAALRDLRSMIGVLSTEEPGTLPAVTLDWPSLTRRLRGRDAEARVLIDPAVSDPARVEPAVQAALLRIAAEATTNAVRHGIAPISLSVQVETDTATLELRNRRATAAAPRPGVGRGTITHRAAAVGGSASSEAVLEDGADGETWRVLAELPARAPVVSEVLASAPIPSPSQEARP